MKSGVTVLTIVLVLLSISAIYDVESGVSDGTCNVAVLPVEGVILPYHGIGDFEMIITPETVESFMDSVEKEDEIKAVLAEINSPGGTPVASERIAERFRSSSLPVVGMIGDQGASGGYMIAAATDYLIASPMSDVGSIGVNMSYLDETDKNEEEGLTYVQLTTGKFKDTGDPNRPITEEERQLLQADLQTVHDHFVDLVVEYRGMTRGEVVELADGSSMPGSKALDKNLIDSLGSRAEAKTALANILEVEEDEVIFCEYDSGFLSFY
jgi:protease-4